MNTTVLAAVGLCMCNLRVKLHSDGLHSRCC